MIPLEFQSVPVPPHYQNNNTIARTVHIKIWLNFATYGTVRYRNGPEFDMLFNQTQLDK